MRIAQIAPPWFPVPPDGYGGTERGGPLPAARLGSPGPELTLVAGGRPRRPDPLRYRDRKEDRLVFIGRSNPDKGIPDAVAISARTGLPLTLMVKIGEPEEKAYWRTHVEPNLHDGCELIENADHETKVRELG